MDYRKSEEGLELKVKVYNEKQKVETGACVTFRTTPGTFHRWSGVGTWTVEGQITPEQTQKARNHNSCILTDAFGGLVGGVKNYQINFSVSDANNFPEHLWSYRIYGAKLESLVSE